MTKSICGIDCTKCELNKSCNGCAETKGKPFGAECMVALCLKDGQKALCEFKQNLIAALNELNIQGMEKVTSLNALKGSFVNLEYTLPSGKVAKFWDDNKIYFGNQLRKKDSERCYGIAVDEKYLMVAEYNGDGSEAEVIVFKRYR